MGGEEEAALFYGIIWSNAMNMDALDSKLRADLVSIYEQVMWLARQQGVTPGEARAWYTHIKANRVKRRVRHFSGKVSRAAALPGTLELRLEHYKRIQTTLTNLVGRHLKLDQPRPDEFVRVVCECERVHIVTFGENYDALRAKGDYQKAGIELIPWATLPIERQHTIWTKALRGRVANASKYRPSS